MKSYPENYIVDFMGWDKSQPLPNIMYWAGFASCFGDLVAFDITYKLRS